ncbi:MAG: xanthine dehydrogenase family protein subunit M [Syntrophobacteraceae bacterium]|nr:xanthine dehydrogenase family protein subunit M [Syntrophobacteraceae bacterium]
MKKYNYHRPQTLKEAFRLMEKYNGLARYIAGGTDIIVRIKKGVASPEALISLRGLEELRGIEVDGAGALTVGSMTLIRELEREPVFTKNLPALSQAAVALANPQVRNVATVGGNLANAAPSADCAPPLLALEAWLTLEGPGGKRDVPISEFFQGPGRTCCAPLEIITRITIPSLPDKTGMAFLKSVRVNQDIALTNAAALLVMEDGMCRKCRLAVGAVAPVPLRLKATESAIEGQKIDKELLGRVGAMVESEISPITDVRASEDYRRVVTGVIVGRAIKQALRKVYPDGQEVLG